MSTPHILALDELLERHPAPWVIEVGLMMDANGQYTGLRLYDYTFPPIDHDVLDGIMTTLVNRYAEGI